MTLVPPLDGHLVLDFSQFLAGPVAALRLADLGARVIKIERPGTGEIGRRLVFGGCIADGDSVTFHATNRNKESFAADLKDRDDLAEVIELVRRADVIVQNFRPGVMERLGLDYESVMAVNPSVIYASVSGYGSSSPWSSRPGQDLLAQAVTGIPWLNGSRDDPPIAVGVSIADLFAASHLVTGILAALVRRARTGVGALVETSLLEGMLDLQYELISNSMFDPELSDIRGPRHTASSFLDAPYGIYPTVDGYLALAMNDLTHLGELLGLDLSSYQDRETWWSDRDAIVERLAEHLTRKSTDGWLAVLEPADIWCAPVMRLREFIEHPAFSAIEMTQTVERPHGAEDPLLLTTTRLPIRFDRERPTSSRGAPRVGEDNERIRNELLDRPEPTGDPHG